MSIVVVWLFESKMENIGNVLHAQGLRCLFVKSAKARKVTIKLL